MILDTEAAVIANFEFLGHTDMDMEEEEGDVEDEIYDASADTKPNKVIINNQKPIKSNKVTYYFILLFFFLKIKNNYFIINLISHPYFGPI